MLEAAIITLPQAIYAPQVSAQVYIQCLWTYVGILQVYEQMQEQGLDPTATTYTALVSAHCKSDNLDAALEVHSACPVMDLTMLSVPGEP